MSDTPAIRATQHYTCPDCGLDLAASLDLPRLFSNQVVALGRTRGMLCCCPNRLWITADCEPLAVPFDWQAEREAAMAHAVRLTDWVNRHRPTRVDPDAFGKALASLAGPMFGAPPVLGQPERAPSRVTERLTDTTPEVADVMRCPQCGREVLKISETTAICIHNPHIQGVGWRGYLVDCCWWMGAIAEAIIAGRAGVQKIAAEHGGTVRYPDLPTPSTHTERLRVEAAEVLDAAARACAIDPATINRTLDRLRSGRPNPDPPPEEAA